jgi:uncharacterized protein (TIGR03435 family)
LQNALTADEDEDRVILDQTGLSGTFDFVFEFAPQPETSAAANSSKPLPIASGPNFQEARRDQLGLKLEKRKGSERFFVVDHIERPSEN